MFSSRPANQSHAHLDSFDSQDLNQPCASIKRVPANSTERYRRAQCEIYYLHHIAHYHFESYIFNLNSFLMVLRIRRSPFKVKQLLFTPDLRTQLANLWLSGLLSTTGRQGTSVDAFVLCIEVSHPFHSPGVQHLCMQRHSLQP